MPHPSCWAARKEFHWMAGGQDTHDTQDSQDAAGPRVGSRFAPANDQRVARASHRPLLPGCLGCPGGPGKAPSMRQRASRLASDWTARKDCRFPVAGPPARNFIGLWAARTPMTPRTARMRQGREWGAASRLQMTSEWPALRAHHSLLGVLGVLGVLARHQACASGLRAWPANCLALSKRQRASRLASELLCTFHAQRASRLPSDFHYQPIFSRCLATIRRTAPITAASRAAS